MAPTKDFQTWIGKYLRYVNYIAAAALYLKENCLLRDELKPEHIKERILGHWGTVPGQSFIYAELNYLVSQTGAQMMFISGPGHGAPGVLANVFAEGTLGEYYPRCVRNEEGTSNLIKDFSWPTRFPSHVTPVVPGSILEGGELGYSLATAYGAVFDNPDLIVACVVGDGEAETGPLAAAWHSNKFLNPKESGAVLPILHDNGYKISGPTIFGAMSDHEIKNYFDGLGYEVRIVEGANLHTKMRDALLASYKTIRAVQKKARSGKKILSPRWPVIVLRSEKGWTGVKYLKGHKVEGNYRSHGIPLSDPKTNPQTFKLLKQWLESYRIEELIDSQGKPLPEVLTYVPRGNLRIAKTKNAYGGEIIQNLKIPQPEKYAVDIKKRGTVEAKNIVPGGQLLRDVFVLNKKEKNFRFMCPDETDSNKLGAMFEVTKRPFMWPLKKFDECMSQDGRVMEILSEHTLQGWLQGYLLTGRHGMFATYEAFATIVSSMVDQYAKFLKQASRVAWRKPIASLNYILTSLGWRQEHNGYSHQNPGFVSSILEKHGEFSSVYFPADANSFLVALEDSLARRNAINVFVVGKNELPQWLSIKEARAQHKVGVGIWEWAHSGSRNPDVVLSSAGDHMTFEAMAAVSMLKKLMPELAVRYVNVSELTALGVGDERRPVSLSDAEFDRYFTHNKPIIFNFHGYTAVIKNLMWGHDAASRISIHGYSEEGTTTTPFDMHVRNRTSRYHLVIDAVQRAAQSNTKFAQKAKKVIDWCEKKLTEHQRFIVETGCDMPEHNLWEFNG